MPINARFRTGADPLRTDLRDGLRYVYQNQIYSLPWSTTFEQLACLPFAKQQGHHAFGWPVYSLDVPWRLGQLEVQGLEVNTPNVSPRSRIRSDVPVDSYPFEVRLVEHGPDGYWQLKRYLSETLGQPKQCWERPNDEFHADWVYDGLRLSITYWFKTTVQRADWEYTSLHIENNRLYPQYLMDTYTEQFSLTTPGVHWQTFPMPYATVPHNYRTSQYIRFTPTPIQQLLAQRQHQLAIWFDEPVRTLGIAQPDYALILPLPSSVSFALETIDLDRGRYEDELTLQSTDKPQVLATASVGALNSVLDQFNEWVAGK